MCEKLIRNGQKANRGLMTRL